ncbi:hypothetical protein CERZMDRAFT_95647 [Cercospora zeae-maydis SCOH1-5]|uniref:Uncharacterized protein n=1 Tax=Cercospora zeae-maydis SCOH1-5 TaxID=717836 RepID=A0A6A6FLN0_9PEZI|nr:hypothetical protein CERZMDRAFT_95647 [Cercospora zeae-maydis SCOH1-5]
MPRDNVSSILKDLKAMEDHGCRYIGFEEAFGGGFCLVLKTGVAKDFFEKQVPKKPGGDRDYVMHHIEVGTDIPHLALRYAGLRNRLVEYESGTLARLIALTEL